MSDFLLSLKDVSLAFGGPQVLDKVSLSIHKGLRAALTGRNGEGKSTLLKVIAGALEPDTGEIVRAPGLKVVYVGQGVEKSDFDSSTLLPPSPADRSAAPVSNRPFSPSPTSSSSTSRRTTSTSRISTGSRG